jgi:peptidoglycan/xylan/chitin deacetylase (PgdA/CDA1 family)
MTDVRRLPILMYHAVAPISGPLHRFGVPPELLREHLGALRAAGYRLTGLTEALALTRAGIPAVALTFDDAYADFLDAVPILTDHGATATLYVPAGHVGTRAGWVGDEFAPILGWPALRDVAAAGIEIGSHGLVHEPLDVIGRAEAVHGITTAKHRIEVALGVPARTFAYPHGYQTPAVRRAVAAAGHDSACVIGRRTVRPDDDRFALPRLQPTPDHTGAGLLRMIHAGTPPTVRLKQLAQPGWRLYRRVARTAGATVT